MACTEQQYEDASEDVVVYGAQGISTEEYEKATCDDLTKTQVMKKSKLSVLLPNDLTIA